MNQKSSIAVDTVQPLTPVHKQAKLPTWGLIVVLIISLFIIKKFIYIKDDSRHGK